MPMAVTRRDFLSLLGGSAAGAVLVQACGVPEIELLVQAPFEIRAAADGDEFVGSNFERKYRSSGQRIYSIAAVKV